MNAVAAATTFDPGCQAASNISSAPAPAQGGFVNLINALLGPQEAPPVEDATPVPDDSQNLAGEAVNVRSPAEIADAMIRSMLGSAVAASNVFSDRAPVAPQPATDKDRQPAQDPQNAAVQAAIVPSLPAPVLAMPVANVGQALPSFGQGSGAKFKSNTTITNSTAPVADPKPVASKADLAFALRLTPLESPAADAGAAIPAQEARQVVPATPVQTQVAAAPAENSPALPEPQSQNKSNTPLTISTESKQRQGSDEKQDVVPAVSATAAGDDPSGDFTRPLPNPAPAPVTAHTTEQAHAAPFLSAEQALRTSESAGVEASAPKTPAAQQIAVRIAGPDSTSVDLQVIERAGQVHVSVRTSDTGLQSSLRQDLGTLVNSLDRSGYRTEAFTGHEAASFTAVAAQSGGASYMDARNNGQDSGHNQRESQHDGSSQGGSRDQSNHSGGGQQQQGRQQNNWIETLEKTQ